MGMIKGAKLKKGYRKLRIGMHKVDVFALLGDPDAVSTQNEARIFTWWSREFKGILRGGYIERRVIVEIEHGVVTGYNGVNIDASIW